MPAAAVIPAPLVYIKVVAVKKLVVEPRIGEIWSPCSSSRGRVRIKWPLLPNLTFRHAKGYSGVHASGCLCRIFYFEEI